MDRSLRRGCQARLRGATARATSRPNAATSSRSILPARKRRRPPPTASPRARALPRSPRNCGKTEKDIDLGTVPKAAMIDRAVADAAFALKEGEVSAPVKGRFGTVLVQVLKIEPEQVRAVRGGRRRTQAGARDRARQDADAQRLRQDRGRALGRQDAGRSGRAAQARGAHHRGDRPLRPRSLGRAGRRAARRSASAGDGVHDRRRRSIATRCRSKAAISGTRSRASRRRASARSTRSRSRSTARWREQEIATRLKAKATEILDKLKAGTTLADVAAADKLQGRDRERDQARRGLAPAVGARRSTRSSAPPRMAPAAPTPPRRVEQVVFRVTDIVVPKLDIGVRRRQAHAGNLEPHALREPFRRVCRPARKRDRRDHQSKRAATRSSPAAEQAPTTDLHADRAAGTRIRQALRARRAAGGVDHAGRRPRDAGLGVSQDRRRAADELPAGIGRRRRGARALFDHRARAGSGLAHGRRPRRDQSRHAPAAATAFSPCNEAPLTALRALVAESRIELPEALPPMAAGIFGYLGYDMVRQMEELPQPNPDPIGIPDAVLVRPTIVVVFDAVKDTITVVTPVRPEKGVSGQDRASRARASGSRRSSTRSTSRSSTAAAQRSRPARSRCWPSSNTTPAEYERMVERRQGVHRRRRHLPGGAVAALRGAVRAAAVLALSRAAAGQPVALPLFPRLRRLRRRRLEPGNPGAGARAARSPSGRSPARARAAPRRTRTRRSKPSCWPIRRSAPST